MINKLSGSAVELIIGAVTVALSCVGSYVAISETTARLDERSIAQEIRIERNERSISAVNERNDVVMTQLTETINELNKVLVGMRVELTYIGEDVKELKGER